MATYHKEVSRNIKDYNLANHGIVCEIALSPCDLQVLRSAVKSFDDFGEDGISFSLPSKNKIILRLIPDTDVPIVKLQRNELYETNQSNI